MEGKLVIIQLGNNKQCMDNGIARWNFAFGLQGHKLRGTTSYKSKSRVDGRVQNARWAVGDNHRTNFKLILIMEKVNNTTDY